MKRIATLLAASLSAMIAAGASHALAQPAPQQPGPDPQRIERMERFMREDMPALTDARIAGLKAGLKLTAEQERLWPPVEQALRDMAAQRASRMNAWRERRAKGNDAAQMDLMERLDRMADGSRRAAESLGKLRDAAKPLYATFDERQKRILPRLVGGGFGGGPDGGWRERWRGHHGRDRG